MGNYVKESFDRNGEVTDSVFFPSGEMITWVIERAHAKNRELSDKELLKRLGWRPGTLTKWAEHHGHHFASWYTKALENFQAPLRDALFAFGVDRAFQGDFNYWKAVSTTVGAISGDKVEVTAKVAQNPDELAKMSDAELAELERQLLSAVTGTNKQIVVQEKDEEHATV